MLLDGKVVVITGALRGIGRAVALGCDREVADVVVDELSGPGAQVVKEIRRAVPAQGDVATPETGKRMTHT
jgi:L-rhamnose 1-dehydrogenase